MQVCKYFITNNNTEEKWLEANKREFSNKIRTGSFRALPFLGSIKRKIQHVNWSPRF